MLHWGSGVVGRPTAFKVDVFYENKFLSEGWDPNAIKRLKME